MENKIVKLREQSKEKSKQRLRNAVGKILIKKGISGLKVNDIAATAGLDKKLIYKYFGGTEQLIEEYIATSDFWSNVAMDQLPAKVDDGGLEVLKNLLNTQFDSVKENMQLQKIILWGLTEKRKSLQTVAASREASGEELLSKFMDPYFGSDALRFRAAAAIISAGLYYINLYGGINGNTYGGVDVTSAEGRKEIKNAFAFMLELLYDAKTEK